MAQSIRRIPAAAVALVVLGALLAPTLAAAESEQQFKASGEYLSKLGGTGTGNGQLDAPTGLAIDVKGHVWVADRDNNRVQQFSAAGKYITKFGEAGSGVGQFNTPQGLTIDSSGGIWVADGNNDRVQKWVR